MSKLFNFVVESNRIEGITHQNEHDAAFNRIQNFLELTALTIDALNEFNTAGELRDRLGMNVRVGNHLPPPGGGKIAAELETIITLANTGSHPYWVHHQFEALHPYMDGNGRTGRAIWLWQMIDQFDYDLSLGFLHMWYYQSLQFGDRDHD